jgi:hypothetical protein
MAFDTPSCTNPIRRDMGYMASGNRIGSRSIGQSTRPEISQIR